MLVQGRSQFFTRVSDVPHTTGCVCSGSVQGNNLSGLVTHSTTPPPHYKLGFSCCLWPYCIFSSIPCTIWMETEFMFPSRFWFQSSFHLSEYCLFLIRFLSCRLKELCWPVFSTYSHNASSAFHHIVIHRASQQEFFKNGTSQLLQSSLELQKRCFSESLLPLPMPPCTFCLDPLYIFSLSPSLPPPFLLPSFFSFFLYLLLKV